MKYLRKLSALLFTALLSLRSVYADVAPEPDRPEPMPPDYRPVLPYFAAIALVIIIIAIVVLILIIRRRRKRR